MILIAIPGCATVTTGLWQTIPVDSNPQGAKVSVDSEHKGVTPCSFKLSRGKTYIVNISKEGYRTAQVMLKRNVCAATAGNIISFGLLGVAVDSLTGAVFKLIPEEIKVDLVK